MPVANDTGIPDAPPAAAVRLTWLAKIESPPVGSTKSTRSRAATVESLRTQTVAVS